MRQTTITTETNLWPSIPTRTFAHLNGVWGSADDDVWAVGEEGTILHFDGVAWTPVVSGTNKALFDVTGTSRSNVFAVGAGGTFLRYDGGSWTTIATSSTNEPYRAVAARAADDVWVVGPQGRAIHFDGTNATQMSIGTEEIFLDVAITSDGDVWAVGPNDTAVRWKATGGWSELSRDTNRGQLLRRVVTNGTDVIALAQDAQIGRWDGARFATSQQTASSLIVDLHLSADGAFIAADPVANVWRIADYDLTHYAGWRLDTMIESLAVLPSGAMWLVGGNGIALLGPGNLQPGTWDPLLDLDRIPREELNFDPAPGVIVAIEAGESSTCVRRSDGTIACAGSGYGPTPIIVPRMDVAIDFAVAASGVCILRYDHQTVCHAAATGMLQVRSAPYDFTALFSGPTQVCGLTTPSQVTECFAPETTTGFGMRAGLQDVVEHAGEHTYFCAVLRDGTVRCGGSGSTIGYGAGPDRSAIGFGLTLPQPVGATKVAVGFDHACAVANREVWCWGDGRFGKVGDGTTTTRPIAVPTGVTPALDVVTTQASTCALMASGTVQCWGANVLGQLGDGTMTDRPTPGSVAGIQDAVAITAGPFHVCALRRNRTVACWGSNASGQLGDGTMMNRALPMDALF